LRHRQVNTSERAYFTERLGKALDENCGP